MKPVSVINKNKDELGLLNLLILVLSVYVLTSLVIETFFKLPEEIAKVLHYIDNTICLVFLFDFLIRFRQAESKVQFMKWGWIDLISSVPTLDFMRAGRLLRLIRLVRILRAFRSTKHIVQHVFKNRMYGTLTSVTIISVLMLLLSTIAILQFETVPESNIKTAEDALWFSYSTMTTAGYGDKYPVTTEGRIIASILMTVGVGLFGTFTAFVSSWFVKGDIENDKLNEANKE